MIRLFSIDTKNTKTEAALSDLWTRKGKPVYFMLKRIKHPDHPDIRGVSFILGPLNIKHARIHKPHG